MTSPNPDNSVLDNLSKWSPLLLLLLGGLMVQLWNRFRARTRRFRWRAWHQSVAIAANDPFWGNVTVQYNGTPVNHVHVTTVEVHNDSSEDQKEVKFTLAFPDGLGTIIGSVGTVESAAIPFDQDFLDQFNGVPPQQTQALRTYVVHNVLTFNRRQKATFVMLVVRNDASKPLVQVSCVHPGFKLEFSPSGHQVDGVPFNVALSAGLATTATAILLLVRFQYHPHPYLNPLFGWFLGLVVTRVGAGVVRAWKAVIRLLG